MYPGPAAGIPPSLMVDMEQSAPGSPSDSVRSGVTSLAMSSDDLSMMALETSNALWSPPRAKESEAVGEDKVEQVLLPELPPLANGGAASPSNASRRREDAEREASTQSGGWEVQRPLLCTVVALGMIAILAATSSMAYQELQNIKASKDTAFRRHQHLDRQFILEREAAQAAREAEAARGSTPRRVRFQDGKVVGPWDKSEAS